MAKRGLGRLLHVDGDDVVAARGQRHGTRSLLERDRTTGRSADGKSGMGAAGGDDVEDVAPYGCGDVDVADAAQQSQKVGLDRGQDRDRRLQGTQWRAPGADPRVLGWGSPSTGEGGSGLAVPGGVVTFRPHRMGSGSRAP